MGDLFVWLGALAGRMVGVFDVFGRLDGGMGGLGGGMGGLDGGMGGLDGGMGGLDGGMGGLDGGRAKQSIANAPSSAQGLGDGVGRECRIIDQADGFVCIGIKEGSACRLDRMDLVLGEGLEKGVLQKTDALGEIVGRGFGMQRALLGLFEGIKSRKKIAKQRKDGAFGLFFRFAFAPSQDGLMLVLLCEHGFGVLASKSLKLGFVSLFLCEQSIEMLFLCAAVSVPLESEKASRSENGKQQKQPRKVGDEVEHPVISTCGLFLRLKFGGWVLDLGGGWTWRNRFFGGRRAK